MSTLLLDTNIVSFLMKNHPLAPRYRRHLEGHVPAVSFMTVGELYEGAFRGQWGARRLEELQETLHRYLLLAPTTSICQRWGEVRFNRRHQPISAQDAWIAATALHYACPLLTHNPDDFLEIPGLSVITED